MNKVSPINNFFDFFGENLIISKHKLSLITLLKQLSFNAYALLYKKVEQTFIVNVKIKKKKFYKYSFYGNAPLRKSWNMKIIVM